MATTTNHIDDAATTATATNATKTETSFVVTGFGPFGGVEENPTTVIVRRLDSYLRSSQQQQQQQQHKSPCNDSEESGEARNPNGEVDDGDHDHDEEHHNASHNKTANGLSVVADLVKEYVVLETSAQDVNKTMDRIRTDCVEAIASEATNSNKDSGGVGGACNSIPRRQKKIILLHLGVGRSEGFRLESCAYNEASFRIPDIQGYQPWENPIVADPSQTVGQCYETSLDLDGLQNKMQRDFPGIATVVSTDPGRFVCNYVYCKSLEVSLPYSARKKQQQLRESVDSSKATTTATTKESLETGVVVVAAGKANESSTVDRDNNNNCAETNFLCESLFLHVPHFDIVHEEEQLAYVAGLIKNLAEQGM